MASTQLNVIGLAKMNVALMSFSRSLRQRVWMNAFRAGTKVFHSAAVANAKAIKRTGSIGGRGRKRLRHIYQSIRLRKKNQGGGVVAFAVGCSDRRAHLVEFGTGPHVIDRRKSKRSVFLRERRGGMPIGDGKYATVVRHPGQRAQPFMRPAFDQHYKQAIEVIVRTAGKEIESLVSQIATTGTYVFPGVKN